MTDETIEAPRKRGRPPGRAPEQVHVPEGLVRVEIISANHAFGVDGRKYWCGETPSVPPEIAEDWIKHERAVKL